MPSQLPKEVREWHSGAFLHDSSAGFAVLFAKSDGHSQGAGLVSVFELVAELRF